MEGRAGFRSTVRSPVRVASSSSCRRSRPGRGPNLRVERTVVEIKVAVEKKQTRTVLCRSTPWVNRRLERHSDSNEDINVKPPSWQLGLQLIRCTICRHGKEINTNYSSAEVSVVHNTVRQSAHRVHGTVLFSGSDRQTEG